jgi:protein phosphatase
VTLRIETASLTDVGHIRERNEDCVDEFERRGARLLVVADGMGGHRGGATASQVTVETIGKVFAESSETPEQVLHDAFETANREVFRLAAETPALLGMGTTCVALWLDPRGQGWVAHVGDSRAYRLRGRHLSALTSDHSVVGELERRGMVTPAEARTHPRRNELLRSIGVDLSLTVDLATVSVEAEDRFLLCSDGLCGLVPDAEIEALLAEGPIDDCVRALVDRAKRYGAPDNVTVQTASLQKA